MLCCWVVSSFQLFATPWTAVHKDPLSSTVSRSLLRWGPATLISIQSQNRSSNPGDLGQKTRGAKSLQSCSTFCNLIDSSPPGFFVHGFLQARILEWVTRPSSRGSSQPRDWTQVFYVCFLHWQAGSLPLEPMGSPRGPEANCSSSSWNRTQRF